MRIPGLPATLCSNALFSGIGGVALLIAPEAIAALMGGFPALICRLAGAGLGVFACDVAWVACRLPGSMRFVKWIFAADAAWVLATPIVMLGFADQLSLWGHLLLIDVGLVVALFAFLEWRGLQQHRLRA